MNEFVVAVGLVLVIEGLLYALAPGRLKQMLVMMERAPEESLRTIGLVAIALGVAIIWLARTFAG